MNRESTTPIGDLESFLEELESFAPSHDETVGTNVVYRAVEADEVVDDSVPEDDPLQEQLLEVEERITAADSVDIPRSLDFELADPGPVAAVDCGIVRLGETENGLIIALRSALVVDKGEDSRVSLFRTGPIYLHNHHKAEILHSMGQQLGKPDFFVELNRTDPTDARPIKVKLGVANDAHQYGDRFRNWFERLVQRMAVTSIENGIVLFDGALTLRTRDTPQTYLKQLARMADERGNAIVAVSKQSRLQIAGKSIRFWLDDAQERVCYRWLTPMMRREGIERVLGNLYVVRLSVLGPTFRVDVKSPTGLLDQMVLEQFFSSTLMRGGYPDILVRAHAHSYFTSPDVIQLQAQAGAKYELTPQGDVELASIFAPFGGRFK